ncbi:SDR family NAD(P)-dependent oxidoreductase [Spongisporangium articulatum]|uniref:SDR family NAD(P)-dependent oxidoreductase n=1 Tax=Spongisporangium articulatum TaxID=3362603 RepID=A0ABW8AIG9_9ACTN
MSTPFPFGATSTGEDVTAGVDLTGRTAVVTGASSGLGAETARVLARRGARVVLAVRDVAAGQRVAAQLPGEVAVEPLDLADLASIDAFTGRWSGPLHVLVDNAGVMATPFGRTAQGWETQFGTNHLGHFALTCGLRNSLAAAGDARVVVLSSVGHINGDVDLDDPNFERGGYEPWLAYGRSKTANILFAVEAARRWAGDGIAVNALNPGRIASTNLSRHVPASAAPASFDPNGRTGISVKDIPQGAATSLLLAASPLVAGITGRYFEDCQIAEPHVDGVRRGVAAYAIDPDRARALWALSEELVAEART